MGVHFRKVGVHTLSTPSRYPAQGCVKLGAHKTGCSNSPTPYNITPYRTPRNSATPGLELPALRACGEDPKGGGAFTIHPFHSGHAGAPMGFELPVPRRARRDPLSPRRKTTSSGGYPLFAGDTGDKLKNTRNPLSPLRKTVPGNTGDKRNFTGDTGDK